MNRNRASEYLITYSHMDAVLHHRLDTNMYVIQRMSLVYAFWKEVGLKLAPETMIWADHQVSGFLKGCESRSFALG